MPNEVRPDARAFAFTLIVSLRSILVAGQVAAAFVLVTTGGLLLSSLLNLWTADPRVLGLAALGCRSPGR